MPSPTCVRCTSTGGFELKEIRMHNAEYKYFAVACRHCGGVAGVVEYFNTGVKVAELTKLVDAYGKQVLSAVSQLGAGIDRVIRALKR